MNRILIAATDALAGVADDDAEADGDGIDVVAAYPTSKC